MAGANRRIILAPAGLGDEALDRLLEQWVQAAAQQNRLAARSAHVLQLTSVPKRTSFGLVVEHEPAEPLGLKDLFDPGRLPTGHDPAEQKRLLRIAAGLFDSLRVAHEEAGEASGARGTRPGIIHGALCPGTVLTSPEGTVKVTDFGLGKAICSALGPDSYLNLAVSPRTGGPGDLYASGVWEILGHDTPGRDDRICAFIDPQIHMDQRYNVFEASQDIIAAGFLLYLLAEHRHPYFYSDPEAHRDVEVAAQIMPAVQPTRAHRKCLNEDSTNPAMKLWCRLVDRMIDRLPQERPTAGHLSEELGQFEPPIPMGDILARRLDALCGEMDRLMLAEVPWESLRARAGALGDGAGPISAALAEQTRAIVQLCDAAQVLRGPQWQDAGAPLADLSRRIGIPEAVSRKARQAAEILQASAAVQADLERIEADLQARAADALGPLQQAAAQLDGLAAGRTLLPPVAARVAEMTAQVQERRRAAESLLQAQMQQAQQWLETAEAALRAAQWAEVERLLGQAPPIPPSARAVQARADAIATQVREQREQEAARQQRQAALSQRLREAEAALARQAFAEVRALLEPVLRQKEFPDLAAKAGPLRQQCDEREKQAQRRQRQEALERQLQAAEDALKRDGFAEVRSLLEPLRQQTEFADLADLAALLREQCDEREREILRRQRKDALDRQLREAEAALQREAFAEVRSLLQPVQAQEEFPDLAQTAGGLQQRCDQQERQVRQQLEALRQAREKADALLEQAQAQAREDTAASLERAAALVGQALDLAQITPPQRERGQDLRSRIDQRLHAIHDEQQRRAWLLQKAQEQLQAARDLLTAGRLQESQALAEPLAASDLPEVRKQAQQILAQIAKAVASHRDELRRRLAAAREVLAQGRFEEAMAAAQQVQQDPQADEALRDGARQVTGAIARARLETYRAGLARQLEQAAEHIRRAQPPEAAKLAQHVLEDPQADETLRQEAQKILRQAERAAQEIQKARQEADQDRAQALAQLRKADLPAARRHAERALQNPYAEAAARTQTQDLLRDLAPLEAAQALADRQEYAHALQAFDAARASSGPEGPAAEAADLLRQRAVEHRARALQQAIERHLAMRAQRQRKSPDLKELAPAESLPKDSPPWLHEAVGDLESLLQEYEARSRPAGKADVLPAAARIGERFEVLECVRADALVEVYRAKECRSGQAVRLERLGPVDLPAGRQGALRQLVELLSKLSHPGLARLRAVEVVAGRPCIARDWLAGPSLQEARDLAPRQVAGILAAASRALAHAHAKHVMHGDIRPEGILLGDPAGSAVRLADLGTAQVQALARRRSHLLLRGTPGYVSPEVVTSLGEQGGAASDIFALGGVLYTVLAGRPPFAQPASGNGNPDAAGAEMLLRTLRYDLLPLSKAAPQAPEGLRRICERAMARKPEDRYADAGQVARDLQLFALQLDAQDVQAALARAQTLFDKRPQDQLPEIQALEGAAAEAGKVHELAEAAAGRAAQAAELAGPEPVAAAKRLIEQTAALQSAIRQAQERIAESQAGARKQLKAATDAQAAGRFRAALDAARGVLGNGYVPDLHPQARQVEAAALAGLQRARGKQFKIAGIVAAVMLVLGAGGYWWKNRPTVRETPRVAPPTTAPTTVQPVTQPVTPKPPGPTGGTAAPVSRPSVQPKDRPAKESPRTRPAAVVETPPATTQESGAQPSPPSTPTKPASGETITQPVQGTSQPPSPTEPQNQVSPPAVRPDAEPSAQTQTETGPATTTPAPRTESNPSATRPSISPPTDNRQGETPANPAPRESPPAGQNAETAPGVATTAPAPDLPIPGGTVANTPNEKPQDDVKPVIVAAGQPSDATPGGQQASGSPVLSAEQLDKVKQSLAKETLFKGWSPNGLSIRQGDGKLSLELGLSDRFPESYRNWSVETGAEALASKTTEDLASLATQAIVEAAKAKLADRKDAEALRYLSWWQDRQKLVDELSNEKATQGPLGKEVQIKNISDGEPVTISSEVAGKYLDRISQIKWMGKKPALPKELEGVKDPPSLEDCTKICLNLSIRTARRVAPNRFLEYFWGSDSIHLICWMNNGVAKAWYIRCGPDPANATKPLQDPAISDFFESKDSSYGIVIAPDGPLCFISLGEQTFDPTAVSLTKVTEWASGASRGSDKPKDEQAEIKISKLNGLCTDTFLKRSTAIWTSISCDRPEPSADEAIEILQATWLCWNSGLAWPNPAPRPEIGGLVSPKDMKAYMDCSYALTGMTTSLLPVEIVAPRMPSSTGSAGTLQKDLPICVIRKPRE